MARRNTQSASYGADLAQRVHNAEQIQKQVQENQRRMATNDLCIAAENNDRERIPSLALRTDINAFGERGLTPLQAAFKGSVEPETVQLLLDRGADVNARGRDGSTALHTAVEADDGIEGVRTLLDNGADPNLQNAHGQTPLHLSAESPLDDGCTRPLLEAGANPTLADDEGNTPLHGAREHAVDALLDYGAVVDSKNHDGMTALHIAARDGYANEALRLLERDADVHARDQQGNTPLHTAANPAMRHEDVVMGLVRAGADAHTPNNDGKTPLQIADQRGNQAFRTIVVAGEQQNLRQAMEQDTPAEAPAQRVRRRM